VQADLQLGAKTSLGILQQYDYDLTMSLYGCTDDFIVSSVTFSGAAAASVQSYIIDGVGTAPQTIPGGTTNVQLRVIHDSLHPDYIVGNNYTITIGLSSTCCIDDSPIDFIKVIVV
jgi:hypothetical protein